MLLNDIDKEFNDLFGDDKKCSITISEKDSERFSDDKMKWLEHNVNYYTKLDKELNDFLGDMLHTIEEQINNNGVINIDGAELHNNVDVLEDKASQFKEVINMVPKICEKICKYINMYYIQYGKQYAVYIKVMNGEVE